MSENLSKNRTTHEAMTAGVDAVCNMSGLGPRMVRRLIATGKLRSVRVGRRRLVHLDSLRLLLNGLES